MEMPERFDQKITPLRAVVESNEGSRLEEDAVFIPFRLKMGRMELSSAAQSPEKNGCKIAREPSPRAVRSQIEPRRRSSNGARAGWVEAG
jgi:hypothetical protein